MKMMTSRLLRLLAAVLMSTACTVKENRDLCPCLLTLDFSLSGTSAARCVELLVTSVNGFVLSDTVDLRQTDEYVISVPRETVHVRAWAGTEGLASEDGLSIPLGQDCPEVYMHDSDVRADGETAAETVIVRKNHCRLTVFTQDRGFPFKMTVEGNIDGYSSTGLPHRGEFMCELKPDMEGLSVMVLPRQIDTSLGLNIEDDKGNLKRFALGEYIVASGYDWNSADLDDISITIDYALMTLNVQVSGWDDVYTYEIMF